MSVAESAARAESPVDKPTTPKLSHYDAAMFDVVNDPKGDLVVRTGAKDDVGLVRVHKAVLMMASPVFRVMLGGPWVEGSKQYDEKNPLVLDDDRTGFIDFCMLIHHQSRDERAVPLSRAVGVAVLCNKYDCTKLLAQNFSWPLLEFFGPHVEDVQLTDLKSNGLRLEDVLCISYAAGDARLFRRCAAFMISRIQGDRKMKHLKTDKDLLAMLPDGIIDHMQVLRAYYLDRLEAEAYKPLTDLQRKARAVPTDLCSNARQNISDYLISMFHIKDGAYKLSESNLSPASAWGAIEKMANLFDDTPRGCDDDPHTYHSCEWYFKPGIMEAINASMKDINGLCLTCEKAGVAPFSGCQHDGA